MYYSIFIYMVSVWFQMRFVEQLWWDDTNFFLAICCRALTPQASHSFLGFMTYMSVLVGQINM